MKLLCVTYGCDPNGVSEPIVAWSWVSRLAERHEVTVLNQRREIEEPLAPRLPAARVIEWVEPPVVGRFERFNSMARPAFPLFRARVQKWVKGAARRGDVFDAAYQPTPVSFRHASPLQGLGIPYVIGPVGGSLSDPPGFEGTDTSPVFTRLRALDGWRLAHDPALRKGFADAYCVIGIADYAREFLAQAGVEVHRFESMPDTAVDEMPPLVNRGGRRGPVRFLSVGRLVRTKGVRDAIAGFAKAIERDPGFDAVFDVVGDGHDKPYCEKLAGDLGVTDRVRFHGMVNRGIIKSTMYPEADVFVFPSYREAGGTVTFEALSQGLPVIAADRGGPAGVIDDSCGIKVSPTSPEEFANQIAEAMLRLASDPELRQRLGEGARTRTEQLAMWPQRIGRLEALLADAALDVDDSQNPHSDRQGGAPRRRTA